jgi:hypothetical protein
VTARASCNVNVGVREAAHSLVSHSEWVKIVRHFEPHVLGRYLFVVMIRFNSLVVNVAPCFFAPIMLGRKILFHVCAIYCPPYIDIPIRSGTADH